MRAIDIFRACPWGPEGYDRGLSWLLTLEASPTVSRRLLAAMPATELMARLVSIERLQAQ